MSFDFRMFHSQVPNIWNLAVRSRTGGLSWTYYAGLSQWHCAYLVSHSRLIQRHTLERDEWYLWSRYAGMVGPWRCFIFKWKFIMWGKEKEIKHSLWRNTRNEERQQNIWKTRLSMIRPIDFFNADRHFQIQYKLSNKLIELLIHRKMKSNKQ